MRDVESDSSAPSNIQLQIDSEDRQFAQPRRLETKQRYRSLVLINSSKHVLKVECLVTLLFIGCSSLSPQLRLLGIPVPQQKPTRGVKETRDNGESG